eukprot:6172025-Pleurochrysis_carterae.AAC.4
MEHLASLSVHTVSAQASFPGAHGPFVHWVVYSYSGRSPMKASSVASCSGFSRPGKYAAALRSSTKMHIPQPVCGIWQQAGCPILRVIRSL